MISFNCIKSSTPSIKYMQFVCKVVFMYVWAEFSLHLHCSYQQTSPVCLCVEFRALRNHRSEWFVFSGSSNFYDFGYLAHRQLAAWIVCGWQ